MATPTRRNHFHQVNSSYASPSPVGKTYIEHDDKNLRDQYQIRRDYSADTMANKNHFFNTSDTPYLNGHKNKSFYNPSLRSSNVFYEHNFGYVNDFPNERLLTPVKHDRFRQTSVEPQASSNNINKPPMTPPKDFIRIQNQEESRARDIEPRRLQDQYNEGDNKKNRRNSEFENNNREVRRDSRRESALSQPPARAQRRESENVHNDLNRSEHRGLNQSTLKRESHTYNKNANDDDNKSTVSIRSGRSGNTIVSNLSCDCYMCPKCLNRQIGDEKRALSAVERARDKELQNRVAQYNARADALDRQKESRARAQRTQISQQQKEEIDKNYYDKLEARRSPSRECGHLGFQQIFDGQEEYAYNSKINGLIVRDELVHQIQERAEDRKYQKEADQRPTNVSLELTEDYYFKKFGDSKDKVLSTLQSQVKDKKRREKEEHDMDQYEARQRIESSRRKGEEEDRRTRDKNNRQKKELQYAYWKDQEEKVIKQTEDKMRKTNDRFVLDASYNEFKRREHDNQVRIRKEYRDFLSSALAGYEKPSYKKLYEERKQHKEATSFDPKKRPKKVYPCGECHHLFEKVHLTKMT